MKEFNTLIKNVKYVDLRFTDTGGKEQHITIPSRQVNENFKKNGQVFDGSSIAGWKEIDNSDMVLFPDLESAVIDPFFKIPTLQLRCSAFNPDGTRYDRDPRGVGCKAEEYLKESGIADTAYFGPEPEFFIFDEVYWKDDINSASYSVESSEGAWSSGEVTDNNTGYYTRVKGGYFPVPPNDTKHNIRADICEKLEQMGLIVEVHHHEVGTAGQCEIGTKFDTLVRRADMNQIFKYVTANVANDYGQTATFMPKPLVGDNGSGMHVHMSLFKNGDNLFSGDKYADLSDVALNFIGGIIKHARTINAFSNASTNSYRRLVPGFEAPVNLTYSSRNRSAAIRIPYEASSKGRRIEVRFGDASGNPYLMFASLLMAGIDGIKNKINPGDPCDKDLFSLSTKELESIPSVCSSLDQAIDHLRVDNAFLKEGGVFSDDLINGYIELKEQEINRIRQATHPSEFDMYYDC